MSNFRQKKLVKEILKSKTDFKNLRYVSDGINCYGFARGLSYIDENHEIYVPGALFYMMKKKEEYIEQKSMELILFSDGTNRKFLKKMHNRIMLDSIALNQPTTRVSFLEIKEDDKFQYFGLAFFEDYEEWHFICRDAESGIWFHKLGWQKSPEPVEWLRYGEKFISQGYVIYCCQDFFYRVEKNF